MFKKPAAGKKTVKKNARRTTAVPKGRIFKPSKATAGPVLALRGRVDIVGATSDLFPAFIPCKPSDSLQVPLILTLNLRSATATAGDTLVKEVKNMIMKHLPRHGALVFRGMPMRSPADVSDFIENIALHLGWKPTIFGGGGTVRSQLAKNVRTSSDEPPSCAMEPHMDKAHSDWFPPYIAFYMMQPVPQGAGGETILTDMRAVTAELRKAGLVQHFNVNGGIQYVKRFWSADKVLPSMQGFTWQNCYDVETRAEANAQLEARQEQGRWLEDDVLEVSVRGPVLRRHPELSEELWVNGLHTNHKSYYEHAEHIDTSLGTPMTTMQGNGCEVPDDIIAKVRATMWKHSKPILLERGDLVILDNMLVAHGRMSWPNRLPRLLLLTHFSKA